MMQPAALTNEAAVGDRHGPCLVLALRRHRRSLRRHNLPLVRDAEVRRVFVDVEALAHFCVRVDVLQKVLVVAVLRLV
jgi:hypothetical protein